MASNCSGRDDDSWLAGDGGGLDAARRGAGTTTWSLSAVVKIADRMVLFPAIVEADRPIVFLAGDPVADVFGQDVDHPHRTELRQDVLADHVGVALAWSGLDLVRWAATVSSTSGAKRLPAAAQVAESAGFDDRASARCQALSACFSVVKVPAERCRPRRSR